MLYENAVTYSGLNVFINSLQQREQKILMSLFFLSRVPLVSCTSESQKEEETLHKATAG